MAPNTLTLIRAALASDPSVPAMTRTAIMVFCRNGTAPQPPAPAAGNGVRILPFAEAANRIGKSKRVLHELCQQGLLKKVRLPGRSRGSGILESDVNQFIESCQPKAAA